MTLYDKQEKTQPSLLWCKLADKTLEFDWRVLLNDFKKICCPVYDSFMATRKSYFHI